MKKIRTLLIALSLVFILGVSNAQNPAFDNGISFKSLFMDYQSQNGGSISDFQSYHRGFEIGFHRKLQNNFNLVVPVKVGVVSGRQTEVDDFHRTVYGLDAQLQYLIRKEDAKVTPYLMLGAGGVHEVEGTTNVQIPVGAGLFFEVAPHAYINWQSEYRYSLEDGRNNLQHGIGFVYLFGNNNYEPEKEAPNDSDGDGIEDTVDLCPQAAGPAELNGCPDSDGDGIPDYQDECPNFIGLKAFNGCPDSDGDGINDNDDECPNIAGVEENNGCPEEPKDTDGDGITDDDDKCPNIAGIAENDGCPKPVVDTDGDGVADDFDECPNEIGTIATRGCPDRDGDGIVDKDDKCPSNFGLPLYNGCPDTDGDGLDDSRDRCPTMPGLIDNNGCPEIKVEDKKVLDLAMRAVQFDTGKSTIKAESYSILNQVVEIMNRYPDYDLSIEGHTDNVGSATNNQVLSEKRAKSIYEYLLARGIPASRLSYIGYGEVAPISDNNTLRGRALNRRVEFDLSPR